MEVCQPGLPDFHLPSWCIEQEIDAVFIAQGVLEIIVIVLSMLLFAKMIRSYKKWKNRNKPPPSIWNPPNNRS